MNNRCAFPQILKLLLGLTLTGGAIALFLLMLLIGFSLRSGLSSIVGEPLPALLAGAALAAAIGAAALTLLRLTGKRWLPRVYAGGIALMLIVVLPLLPARDEAVRSMLQVLATPVVMLLQAVLHLLPQKAAEPECAVRRPGGQEISFAQIASISRETLVWRDAEGRLQSVDLALCARRWKSSHPGSSGRCVGERYAPCRIVLWTDEYLTLVNDVPGSRLSHQRAYARFRGIVQQLTDAGWITFDAT